MWDTARAGDKSRDGTEARDGIFYTYLNVSEKAHPAEKTEKQELERSCLLVIDMIDSGSGGHLVDGRELPCKENDIYVISPDTPHRYFLTEDSEGLTVRRIAVQLDCWLNGRAADKDSRHYCYGVFEDGEQVAYAMLNSTAKERISDIYDSIECELADRENEWKSVVKAYITLLLSFIGRYVGNTIKASPERGEYYATVNSAIEIIKREFGNPELSLDALAQRLFLSQARFSQIFKEVTGGLFSDYLREVRLSRAAELLKESDMTVDKIVAECGLCNIPSFYRNFRNAYGMTPQIYRQMAKISIKQTNIDNIDESETKKMEILNQISANVQAGKAKIVAELITQALEDGVPASEILDGGLLAGMSVIGEKFKNNEIYVPQVLVAARAMSKGAELLKPHLAKSGVRASGKVCIGTVAGDLHDIGKNLVKMMMEGKGLEVIDLGVDVAPERFVSAAVNDGCSVICLSSLLTTTMPVMAEVVKAFEAAGIRDKVKIMVGGAPVKQKFCDDIGADCYTPDAASAADAAVAFFKE